jgi:TrmH family RNA methyltransferase
MRRIDSATNPLVKTLRRLAHPRKREAQFLLEGKKLVEAAIASGTEIATIVVSSTYRSTPPRDVAVVELEDTLFTSVSTLASPEGILAIARRPSAAIPREGLIAVAAGIQDPGNLGALARVVEATGAAGLIVLKGSTDPFGPKAVRGSMGSVLRVPVCEVSDMSELDTFRKIALVPRGGSDYKKVNWASPCAVVLGGESAGIDDEMRSRCDAEASIPMHGEVESLNVATAAALVLYEATRREG